MKNLSGFQVQMLQNTYKCLLLQVQMIMANVFTDIAENTQMAREYALLGNYDTAAIYYQGVVTQIQKLLTTIRDSSRKQDWTEVFHSFFVHNFHVCFISFSVRGFLIFLIARLNTYIDETKVLF